MKKAITTDVVSINPTSSPTPKDLENAFLGCHKVDVTISIGTWLG